MKNYDLSSTVQFTEHLIQQKLISSNFTGPKKVSELTKCRLIKSIKKTINKCITSKHFHFFYEYVNQALNLHKSSKRAMIFVIRYFVHNETNVNGSRPRVLGLNVLQNHPLLHITTTNTRTWQIFSPEKSFCAGFSCAVAKMTLSSHILRDSSKRARSLWQQSNWVWHECAQNPSYWDWSTNCS